MAELEKNFDFKTCEQELYSLWEKAGIFTPKIDKSKKPFCIIMPPPNANDPLHIGHAMFVTVEDILTRYHRMKGEASLWLPGTDHAGIETQYVFEKKLAKAGQSRFDFDRETLYQKIWDYVQENSGIAVEQMKRLGASADWSRFKFTLDKDIVSLVLETFKKLFKDGLIYRGERLVNYCPKCGTGYSDLETEHEERQGKLYYFKYPFVNGDEVVVATTRPETMLGDTAVAVNPKDKRYQNLIGQKINLPIMNREIPLLADEMVDLEFGTGAVKITPAHDKADFEVAKRHKLPIIQVIDFSGKMTLEAGEFSGLTVNKAREAVVAKMTELGLVEKIVDYSNNLSLCYRCHGLIEPLPLFQFFIKTRPLVEKALKALDNRETVVWGAGREKILRNWMEQLEDWNISRQIVWGIRIPVWYEVRKNPEMVVGFLNAKGEFVQGLLKDLGKNYSFSEIEKGLQFLRVAKEAEFVVSEIKPEGEYLQETDSFDTWFSSGQWPVVTLKTNQPGDFEFFYPTSVMETGYDILPIWVMRMMLLGIYLTGKSPFKDVYLHGLVRDEKGRKMSKSVGNVVNPIDVVGKYGADALRMALMMSTTPGNDSNIGEEKIRGMRNLVTKLWNAAKFVQIYKEKTDLANLKIVSEDQVFENKLNSVIKEISFELDNLKPGQAAETVHNEFWHWFCDQAIEDVKNGKLSIISLERGLKIFLKLFHPFMPFVTEEIWRKMFAKQDSLLAIEKWPTV